MNLNETLKKYNQEHLLEFDSELTNEEKANFYDVLEKIPYQKMQNIYLNSYNDETIDKTKIEPIQHFDKRHIDKNTLETIGLSYLNKYAIITLGGGSGTRLGYPGPKGTYKLDINGEKISIFGLIAKDLKEIYQKYNIYIPWCILTNKENEKATINHFKDNNYFNYPKDKIYFFFQKNLPILDTKGNILLKNKTEILEAANGNGEVFKALNRSGLLKKLKEKNIKYVQISNIDNILCKVFDPVFIGLLKAYNIQIGSKTFKKDNDNQNEYVFCKYKNKPYLLPYTYVNNKNSDTFAGISLYNIKALEKLKDVKFPYHRAYKAYAYIDVNGNYVPNNEKNAFKFEKYIFDAFPNFDNMILYRVDKQEEFAPIKNKEGTSSPKTAIALYEKVKNS